MNFDFNTAKFAYSAIIKLDAVPTCKARSKFPGISDLSLSSRAFETYVDCATSISTLMSDFVAEANAHGSNFMTSPEINPFYNEGKETRSKDWEEKEISRIWIFEKGEEEKVQINAIAQARIYTMGERVASKLN